VGDRPEFLPLVNKPRRTIILICSLILLGANADLLRAESFGDFFKNLFSHPQKHPSPARKSGDKGKATPTPTPVSGPSAPELPVRTASVVTEKNPNRDIPYGIPVANKKGFVTSPYAPDLGLVDVRGIPSGTEVKDPFTGKVFLTP
jgi:hypothetical protein